MQNQTADVTWKDNGVPVSARFDDPYFSLEDGLAETQHVFLDGNRLSERFHGDIHVAELGFGTGLSFLLTWQAWRMADNKGSLTFTSFEAFPMARVDLERALAPFASLSGFAERLISQWSGETGRLEPEEGVHLNVIVGDARETLPRWEGCADAWYLDGFSPAKNPEMWSEELMQAVGRHTKAQGTFATYTAAGFVRRALIAAGFEVERTPGFGRKRHMTRGVMRG